MVKRILWISWGVLFGICCTLAHITEPVGHQLWAIPAFGALFFVPPVWLLVLGLRDDDKKSILWLQRICVISVAATTVVLIGNVISALGGKVLGMIMNELYLFTAVPAGCLRSLFLSLLLWCGLFFAAQTLKKPSK